MTRVHEFDPESFRKPKKDEAAVESWPVDAEGQKTEEQLEKLEKQNPGGFKEALITICEETSFQGLAYIVAPTPFTLRR